MHYYLTLGTLDYFISDSCFIQDYIRGTFTETIGIILTIILIEIFLGQNIKNENIENAKKGLARSNNIMNIYLANYNESAFIIAYKYAEYNNQRKIGLKKDFPFTNLSELFSSSTSLFDSFDSSKVSLYFKRLDDLKEVVKKNISNRFNKIPKTIFTARILFK